MAAINLLPRKAFEITLDSGEIIKGQFGTWALKRLTDKNNTTLQESGVLLSKLSGLLDYILCAVEFSAREAGAPFSFTDIHVCKWVDEFGGVGSADFVSLINHTAEENAKEEKKTEAEP